MSTARRRQGEDLPLNGAVFATCKAFLQMSPEHARIAVTGTRNFYLILMNIVILFRMAHNVVLETQNDKIHSYMLPLHLYRASDFDEILRRI